MIYIGLLLLGLCLGSFVNALAWRVHEQAKSKQPAQELSITKGRSMCPHCKHELAAKDLLPVFSWLSLKGRCRYCNKPISAQYPLIEALTALLFVASYLWWAEPLHGAQTALFVIWLPILTGLIALFIYDLKWMLLPDRIVAPLSGLAVVYAIVAIFSAQHPALALLDVVLAVAVGGGIFYVLFQLSGGKWIGGGDVKLGWMLGLLLGTPGRALLMIFLGALLGSMISLPLMVSQRIRRTSLIPFGPFLIVAAIIVQLFGHDILVWYQQMFFPYY